jgi:outer membrane protein assembly factor BamB
MSRRIWEKLGLLLAALPLSCGVDEPVNPRFTLGSAAEGSWSQWGRTAGHGGQLGVTGQRPERVLGELAFDPFIPEEQKETGGDVLVHYQSPLVDGDDLFMEVKSGRFTACDPPGSAQPAPCGPASWNQETWGEVRLAWEGGALVEKWRFESDWKPEPDNGGGLGGWEPVFHAALAGAYVVIPGAGGTVFVVDRSTGAEVARVNPFDTIDPNTFVAGPLTVGPDGSVVYDVLSLAPGFPWQTDVAGAWLVKIAPDGTPSKASFAELVPGAPAPQSLCGGRFAITDLPWPPSPDARPPEAPCGSQRPGVNVAPAIGPDGTIYTVSRAHLAGRYSYLVAVNPDLGPRWAASLRDRLADGCGSPILPPNGQPGGCRDGALPGVDPATNGAPAGSVSDLSTASPVVAPDGSILYGAYTRYNNGRGHLFRFGADGGFLGSYDFGWDVTPAIYPHGGSYSVVIKDNHYGGGTYCNTMEFCPPVGEGPYDITQLGPDLVPEWKFSSTNTMSCTRGADGQPACTSDHPEGFEWCINAPAVDGDGTVYANGEDGVLYAIAQGGKQVRSLFLRESLGAAYTPLAIDAKGRVYAENFGEVVVVGE